MSLEEVLKFAFHSAKKHPRTMLPAVLSWIPTILTTTMLAFMLSDVSITMLLARSDLLLAALGQLGVLVVVSVLSHWIIQSFLQVFYTDLTWQFAKHKRPDIAKSFYVAKERLLSMMGLNLLIALLLTTVLVVPMILLGFIGLVVGGTDLAIGAAFLGMLLGMIPMFYLNIRLWFTPVMLLVENKRGIEALQRSYRATSGLFWRVFLVLLIIGTVSAIVSGSVGAVPLMGFSLTLLVSLFITMWSSTAPAAFYFEYKISKKR